MLFVTLKTGESLLFPGCDVSLDVLEIQDSTVRFNISAPSTKISPGELRPDLAETPKLRINESGNLASF